MIHMDIYTFYMYFIIYLCGNVLNWMLRSPSIMSTEEEEEDDEEENEERARVEGDIDKVEI